LRLLADILGMIADVRRKLNSGFTLVEIMIVVMILGLLCSIVIPYYVQQRASAQGRACINNLHKISEAESQFSLETGKKSGDPISYPSDLTPYIRLNSAGQIPSCPAGGVYSLTAVGTFPACSLGNTVEPPHVTP
jgi:prepilin-type N-terminal cleavage/methylation domain-containing protein